MLTWLAETAIAPFFLCPRDFTPFTGASRMHVHWLARMVIWVFSLEEVFGIFLLSRRVVVGVCSTLLLNLRFVGDRAGIRGALRGFVGCHEWIAMATNYTCLIGVLMGVWRSSLGCVVWIFGDAVQAIGAVAVNLI